MKNPDRSELSRVSFALRNSGVLGRNSRPSIARLPSFRSTKKANSITELGGLSQTVDLASPH